MDNDRIKAIRERRKKLANGELVYASLDYQLADIDYLLAYIAGLKAEVTYVQVTDSNGVDTVHRVPPMESE